MNRDEALTLVKMNLKKDSMVKHVLAVEAIMRGLAEYFNEDIDLWGLVGLLHDIDYESVEGDMKKHGLVAESILHGKVNDSIIRAIKSHNYVNTCIMPESRMERALISADAISGLIVACALVMPSKRLSEVKVETIVKKFKDKDFARGSDRSRILMCESLGIKKEQFFEIALKALQRIDAELGL
ncbi:MAG: HDIG domain-containing protein [Nitrososphaerota archaeon]|nr:HDIG domain-containing protein [Nitrososphaerota archaeon]